MPDTRTSPESGQQAANTADFTFQVGELDAESLKVTAFSGCEEVSRLFGFRVELCSDDPNIDFQEVVGKQCLLTIHGASGARYVNGIVRQFEQTGHGAHLSHYAADVAPIHWYLTKRFKSRIFLEANCQDMTVAGIIRKVFADAGIPEENYRFALQAKYEKREFVVQYRESDFDFIARLMEHEGIFFFFEHTADGHVMVIGDSDGAHTPTPNEAEFVFRHARDLVQDKEFVYHARDRQRIETSAVTLDDFNFKQVTNPLRSTAEGERFTSLEYRDHPGDYDDAKVGDRYARVRLEAFAWQQRVVDLAAVVRAWIPGYKFTLADHPRDALNREFLLLRLEHRGSQPQSAEAEAGVGEPPKYDVDARVIPAETPFRPERVTPCPKIYGTQTALVTGAEDEEIYTDKDGYGRVKLHFHWDLESDHDENASCWVRVSQGWAGGNYGMMFLPRVGQEVIVSFLEGNPDRPIVTGRVYNNDNMPPYKLPDEKTKSTIKSRSSKGGGGFNELRFEDKKDEEQIFLHGQKDLDMRILNDERDWIGRDKHEIIKRNQKKQIEGGEGRAVGGDQGISVGGDRGLKVKGAYGLDIGAEYTLKTGGDIVIGGPTFKLVADGEGGIRASTLVLKADVITLKAGGSFITIDGGGVSIVGPTVKINSGGSAASVGGSSVAPVPAPGQPDEAATGDPGEDYKYEQDPDEQDPLENALLHDEDESNEKHWIGVRLFDDNGLPLAGERYVVVLPDGTKIAKGRTNKNGEAEIRGIEPGSCQITFPDLDGATWQTGPAPGGGGGGSGSPGGGAPGAL